VNLIATASGHDAHVNLVVLDLCAADAKVSAPHSLGKFGAHVKLAVALKAPTGIAALVNECPICSERHDAQAGKVIHRLKFQDVEPNCALTIRGFLAAARGREGKSVTQRHAGHPAAK
jgi:hypothetical protein